MSKLTRQEMLTLALGVLPTPPAEVEVLSEDGGAFALKIVEQEGELLHAFAPRQQVRKELHLLARVTDEQRGRYEVEFEIDEAYFHSGAEALVHAAVSGVRHRKMRRSAPRLPITERTKARVLFCRTLPRHETIDVRLSDVSTTGIGFTAAKQLHAGDMLVIAATLAGQDRRHRDPGRQGRSGPVRESADRRRDHGARREGPPADRRHGPAHARGRVRGGAAERRRRGRPRTRGRAHTAGGGFPAASPMPIVAVRACTHAARRISEGGLSVRVFTNQRGSVASELSFGAMVVGILVLGGLYMVAQIEGVSFSMLLQQLRSG